MAMPEQISFGDKYGPAMLIGTQEEADAYFEECVQHCMRFGRSREEAERIERGNIGYWAGYGYDREKVERLFKCAHPVFGSVATSGHPTAEQALKAGYDAGLSAAAEELMDQC